MYKVRKRDGKIVPFEIETVDGIVDRNLRHRHFSGQWSLTQIDDRGTQREIL